jgi:hypothetical protein
MILSAVLSMIAVTGLQLLGASKTNVENVAMALDLTILQSELNQAFQNEVSCSLSLKGNPFDPVLGHSTQIKIYRAINGVQDLVPLYDPADNLRNMFGKLQLTSFTLTTTGPAIVPGVYPANLEIKAMRPNGTSNARGDINLTVKTSGATIVSCNSLSFNITDAVNPGKFKAVPLPICATRGQGLYTYHGKQIGCVNISCPAGKNPLRWDYDGNLICN